MENLPPPYKARRKTSQPVRSTAGTSLQPPQDSGAQQPAIATPAKIQETPTERVASTTPSAPSRSAMTTAEKERIMREFLVILDTSEKLSDAFAKLAVDIRQQEEASKLTPLMIPPRPSDLQKTSTAQALSSAQATTHAENAPHIPTIVTDPQHAEQVEYTMDEVLEAAEKAEAGSRVEENARDEVVARDDVVSELNSLRKGPILRVSFLVIVVLIL